MMRLEVHILTGSSDFNNAINEAIYLGSGKQIKVVAPFINATKDRL